jgi:hypothetical protein
MKTIFRIFVILLAAVAVTGATWAYGQYAGSRQVDFERGGRGEFFNREGRPAPPVNGERFQGREGRGGFDRDGAQWVSARGWLSFGETLIPIALIITLIALPTSLWKRYRRTAKVAPSESSAA